jgi:hypothetical protein
MAASTILNLKRDIFFDLINLEKPHRRISMAKVIIFSFLTFCKNGFFQHFVKNMPCFSQNEVFFLCFFGKRGSFLGICAKK